MEYLNVHPAINWDKMVDSYCTMVHIHHYPVVNLKHFWTYFSLPFRWSMKVSHLWSGSWAVIIRGRLKGCLGSFLEASKLLTPTECNAVVTRTLSFSYTWYTGNRLDLWSAYHNSPGICPLHPIFKEKLSVSSHTQMECPRAVVHCRTILHRFHSLLWKGVAPVHWLVVPWHTTTIP